MFRKSFRKKKSKEKAVKASKEKEVEEKDSRPPPPKPVKGSIGINVAMMNSALPEDLMPDEIEIFKNLAKAVGETERLSYETLLVFLGIAVGKFDDFRVEQKVKVEGSDEEKVLTMKEKLEATLKKYNWVAFTDAKIGESLRKLLENLEKENVVTQVEGTDKYQIN